LRPSCLQSAKASAQWTEIQRDLKQAINADAANYRDHESQQANAGKQGGVDQFARFFTVLGGCELGNIADDGRTGAVPKSNIP